MSDTRHCDGPNCNISEPIVKRSINWITVSYSYAYLTMSITERQDLHFHNEICAAEWTIARNQKWAQEQTKNATQDKD